MDWITTDKVPGAALDGVLLLLLLLMLLLLLLSLALEANAEALKISLAVAVTFAFDVFVVGGAVGDDFPAPPSPTKVSSSTHNICKIVGRAFSYSTALPRVMGE